MLKTVVIASLLGAQGCRDRITPVASLLDTGSTDYLTWQFKLFYMDPGTYSSNHLFYYNQGTVSLLKRKWTPVKRFCCISMDVKPDSLNFKYNLSEITSIVHLVIWKQWGLLYSYAYAQAPLNPQCSYMKQDPFLYEDDDEPFPPVFLPYWFHFCSKI